MLITRDKIIEFHERIDQSAMIWLCGVTLSSITEPKYYQVLQDRVSKGARLKVIISDPQGQAIQGLVENSEHSSLFDVCEEIDRTIIALYRLLKECPASEVEIRVIDTALTSSIIITDPGTQKARAHVEFYSYKAPLFDRPHVELVETSDVVWFKYIKDEFERRWMGATQLIPFPSLRFTLDEPELITDRVTVFLDRDGVINEKPSSGNYVTSVDEFVFEDKAIESIRELLEHNFYVVVITNQAGIQRKMILQDELDRIHTKLLKETRSVQGKIQAIYICPHSIQMNCSCRKPRAGLLLRAKLELGINLQKSYFIGDSETDIEAGTCVRCTTIHINSTRVRLKSAHPTYTVDTIRDAVKKIIELETE